MTAVLSITFIHPRSVQFVLMKHNTKRRWSGVSQLGDVRDEEPGAGARRLRSEKMRTRTGAWILLGLLAADVAVCSSRGRRLGGMAAGV